MFTSFEKKKKKKRTEETFPYWSSLVRMAGSCEKKKEKREREREKISTRHSVETKRKISI
jgi:hypothetical protein